MATVSLKVQSETHQKIENLAKTAGLSADKLADVLLNAFIEGEGRIFTGAWKEGPGIRLIPDWPRFSSGIVKLKTEEMK